MNRIQFKVFLFLVSFYQLGFSQDVASKIDSLYTVEGIAPGFSIAVFKEDTIAFQKQYGYANLDYEIPINSKTLFDVASIAKQFTAYAILLLETQGKLSIKEPAYKYIEGLPRYKKGNPTIEQLLNQTSGIREVDLIAGVVDLTMNDLLTQSQMMNLITKVEVLNFPPGEYFQYTNSNYILLADIIAKVSGMSYDDFMKDAVFEPFGMTNTIKKQSTFSVIKNRAIGYIEDDGAFYKTHLHGYIYDGDGQILTTTQDMHKWHLGLNRIKTENPELYNKMHTKAKLNNGNTIDYGLGVEFTTHNGYKAYGFDGMIKGGFVSKYLYFPELDMAFFTTQNTFDEDFDEQFFQLVDLYVSENTHEKYTDQTEKNKIIELSEDTLKQYEGDYLFMGSDDEDSKLNTIQLVDGELLVLTTAGDEITRLKPLGNHQFLFNDKLVVFDIKPNLKSYKYFNSENELPWEFITYTPYDYTDAELKTFEGDYVNKGLQISKRIVNKDDTLYLLYRNGAWKDQLEPLSKDVFDTSFKPIKFVRDDKQIIIGIEIMGLFFEKL